MKLLTIAALVAASLFAQAPEPAKPAPVVLKKGNLTEAQYEKMLRLQVGYQQAQSLQEARTELALLPWKSEINALVSEQCRAIGVPDSKIPTECKFDADKDKGKGFGEVRWEKPAEPAKPEPTPDAKPTESK